MSAARRSTRISGPGTENTAEVIGSQQQQLNSAMIHLLDLNQLRQELELRGLDSKGNKTVLGDRLEEALTENSSPSPTKKTRGTKRMAQDDENEPEETFKLFKIVCKKQAPVEVLKKVVDSTPPNTFTLSSKIINSPKPRALPSSLPQQSFARMLAPTSPKETRPSKPTLRIPAPSTTPKEARPSKPTLRILAPTSQKAESPMEALPSSVEVQRSDEIIEIPTSSGTSNQYIAATSTLVQEEPPKAPKLLALAHQKSIKAVFSTPAQKVHKISTTVQPQKIPKATTSPVSKALPASAPIPKKITPLLKVTIPKTSTPVPKSSSSSSTPAPKSPKVLTPRQKAPSVSKASASVFTPSMKVSLVSKHLPTTSKFHSTTKPAPVSQGVRAKSDSRDARLSFITDADRKCPKYTAPVRFRFKRVRFERGGVIVGNKILSKDEGSSADKKVTIEEKVLARPVKRFKQGQRQSSSSSSKKEAEIFDTSQFPTSSSAATDADNALSKSGIGSVIMRMMQQKMGYIHGKGLGREKQGIVEPIHTVSRPRIVSRRGTISYYGPEVIGPKFGESAVEARARIGDEAGERLAAYRKQENSSDLSKELPQPTIAESILSHGDRYRGGDGPHTSHNTLAQFDQSAAGIKNRMFAAALAAQKINDRLAGVNPKLASCKTEPGSSGDAFSGATSEMRVREQRRKSRWSNTKAFVPGMPTILPSDIDETQRQCYLLQMEVEEATRRLRTGDFLSPPDQERSPSPEPIYDANGKHLNTREVRKRQELEHRRYEKIQALLRLNPNYKAPADYRAPNIRLHDKVWIPQEDENPRINFVGLLIGRRGNTLKALEAETGAKIIIRGKGSNKVNLRQGPLPGENEPLHAYITGRDRETVKRGCDKIREIINTALKTPDGQNGPRKLQMRELAIQKAD